MPGAASFLPVTMCLYDDKKEIQQPQNRGAPSCSSRRQLPCDTSGREGLAACFWPRPGGSQICTADPMPPGADGTRGSPRGERSVSPCRPEPAAARTDGDGASDGASLKQNSRAGSPVSDEERVIGGWNSRFSIFFLSLFHRLIFSKLPLLGSSGSVQLSCQRSSMATVSPQPVGLSWTSAAQFQEGPPLPAWRTDPCGGAAATGREGAGVSPAAGSFSGAHGKPAGGVRTFEERSSLGTRVRAEAGSVSSSIPTSVSDGAETGVGGALWAPLVPHSGFSCSPAGLGSSLAPSGGQALGVRGHVGWSEPHVVGDGGGGQWSLGQLAQSRSWAVN